MATDKIQILSIDNNNQNLLIEPLTIVYNPEKHTAEVTLPDGVLFQSDNYYQIALNYQLNSTPMQELIFEKF